MKFCELSVGRVIEAGPYSISEEEIVRFARAYDPQWFHVDRTAAEQGPFDGLIASGWHSCAIAMRLMVDAVLHDSESFASPGLEHIRWKHPVRPGDELRLRLTVLEQRRSASQPDLGIVVWKWQLFNQTRTEVMELVATSMFALVAGTDDASS